ncbi:LLM class flavin-dependent oxidoreductase [Myxococcota bacterium]|nr:LLM class flavin-dependent oxidoreductase [Myxococcota bacterium]
MKQTIAAALPLLEALPLKFALFYEIPVPRPWDPDSESRAYHNVIEQAVFGEKMGFHAFWTVEHHFLEEFSHSSNPEVLYGAIAALTTKMRIGYGVRLMPKPYNHPVRTAESVATLDIISRGRVDFGTGRSTSRPELEGFGIDPRETRAMWEEGLAHTVGCWTHEEYEFEGKYWSMPRRRVIPKPVQAPHPPLWAATGSRETHELVGRMGLGLCSFSAGVSLEELAKRIQSYRKAIEGCTEPVGSAINNQVATFSMLHCAATSEQAYEQARESFEWYPTTGFRIVGSVAELLQDEGVELGDFNYLRYLPGATASDDWEDQHKLEDMLDQRVCVAGDPDEVIDRCRTYEELGVDLLLCMVNPYKIPHEQVLESIRLMGEHVIPAFEDG